MVARSNATLGCAQNDSTKIFQAIFFAHVRTNQSSLPEVEKAEPTEVLFPPDAIVQRETSALGGDTSGYRAQPPSYGCRVGARFQCSCEPSLHRARVGRY